MELTNEVWECDSQPCGKLWTVSHSYHKNNMGIVSVMRMDGDAWLEMKSYPTALKTGIPLCLVMMRGNGRRGGRTGGRTGGRNGGRGRIPARQEYSEEGSVHTEPAVSVHEAE
ncbi:hypothetical protein L1987_34837 [Smallanthus sonchifolius]|uniref:Uncharacterized protein n=1 Tax=Smallanthus sonchifolius TaxID=185202 RepID=A0ACB9HU82_9ASTR|nr:hypothetical protein L1987_34837 [Smallanthus sonchifolius]